MWCERNNYTYTVACTVNYITNSMYWLFISTRSAYIKMHTIVEDILILAEPRFDEDELGLPADDLAALLLIFPLDNDR